MQNRGMTSIQVYRLQKSFYILQVKRIAALLQSILI